MFLVPLPSVGNSTGSCCGHLSARFSLGWAACIPTGWRRRNGRTACKNAARSCSAGIAQQGQPLLAKSCRTERTARPCADRASAVCAGRASLEVDELRLFFRASLAPCCPCNQVGGISSPPPSSFAENSLPFQARRTRPETAVGHELAESRQRLSGDSPECRSAIGPHP